MKINICETLKNYIVFPINAIGKSEKINTSVFKTEFESHDVVKTWD